MRVETQIPERDAMGDRWGLRNAAKKNDVRTRRTLLSLWAEKCAQPVAEGIHQHA